MMALVLLIFKIWAAFIIAALLVWVAILPLVGSAAWLERKHRKQNRELEGANAYRYH